MKIFNVSQLRVLTLLTSSLLASSLVSTTFARDLTYKFGAGYRQTTAVRVDDNTKATNDLQLNGLELSYGIAPDFTVGAFFGMTKNFAFAAAGPKLRYDLQRLISRDSTAWQYLRIFSELAFLVKFGNSAKAGVSIHAPDLGFEILPFTTNNLAILTSAGLVMDFGGKSTVTFTQGMFGDVGVKYYF